MADHYINPSTAPIFLVLQPPVRFVSAKLAVHSSEIIFQISLPRDVGWQIELECPAARVLAARLGISRQTLHRLETYDDVPPSHTYVIRGLRQVFEEAGVEFIGSPCDVQGVRLWKQIEPAP